MIWGRYTIEFNHRIPYFDGETTTWTRDFDIYFDRGDGQFFTNHPRYQELHDCIKTYYNQLNYAGLSLSDFVQKMLGDPD